MPEELPPEELPEDGVYLKVYDSVGLIGWPFTVISADVLFSTVNVLFAVPVYGEVPPVISIVPFAGTALTASAKEVYLSVPMVATV